MFKKVISIILCAAMSLSLFTASITAEEAVSEPPEKEGILQALRLIEPVKENYGLTETDLVTMKAAAPVKTYEYTSEGLSFVRNFIPLVCNGALTAWAVENIDGSEVFYQISTTYIDEVNKAIDGTEAYALIYDVSSCYLYDGVSLQKLGGYEEIEGRSTLTADVLEPAAVELSSVGEAYDLEYTNEAATYGAVPPNTTYKCDVLYITQRGYSLQTLCWAASIACIVNYVKGTYYTAWQIYEENKSVADTTGKIAKKKAVDILEKYGLLYQYKEYVPSLSVIEKNIMNGYPIYGIFTYGSGDSAGAHACVIHGCTRDNTGSEKHCIYIMDPEIGFTTALYTSSSYQYVSSYTGVTLTLSSTTSMY